MFDLAYNGRGKPVQVRVIGERQEIPARYLEQIFQRLRRASLVKGKRGPGGGYVLARPASEISLLEIVEAIDGPLTGAVEGGEGEAAVEKPSPHRPDFLWGELASEVARRLASRSLEAICRDAAQAAVRRSDTDGYIYQI